jgi:hemoglobin
MNRLSIGPHRRSAVLLAGRMSRLAIIVGIAVFACGGANKPAPTAATPEPVAEAPVEPPPPAPPPAPKTLFERLGGQPAIDAVVAEFVSRTTTDPRIKERFFNTDAENLKRLLSEFVCQATGGPCKYTGREMGDSHAGMELVEDEFNALVEDLVGALDKFKVPDKEKGELLGALGPLKPAIVVAPDKLKPIADAELAKVQKVADKVTDDAAKQLLQLAVTAGKRGQRSYAEQLFSRAELIVGTKALASAAGVFRAGAPPRVTTTLTKAKDTSAQPKNGVGGSDEDAPAKKPEIGRLTGTLTAGGKPLTGLGMVMLTPLKGGYAKRVPKQRVMEQRDKQFAPHLLAIPVGSTVQFPNFDALYHNVFSLSAAKRFDLGMYRSGDQREMKFDKPGIVRLGCNIHASMAAYVIIVSAPHYVVVEPGGSFTFRSLKPGKYKVEMWSEQSSEPTTSELVIKTGDNDTALDVQVGAAAGPSADKFGGAR